MMVTALEEQVTKSERRAAKNLELVIKAKKGDREALDELIRLNWGLVVGFAVKLGSRQKPEDIDDMISEGNMAVLRAVKTFDPAVGIRFGTYAGRAIQSAIIRHNNLTRVGLWDKAARQVRTLEEHCIRTGVSAANMSLEEVAKTVNGTTSLNAAAYRRIVGGRDQPSEKVFNDKDDTPTPLEIVAKKEYEEGVLSHVAKLRPRLQEAVSRRYGIGEYRMRGGMKQGEVAKEMGVSKQRVYQLENAALAEIRELMAGKKYQEDGSDHVRMDRGRQVRLAPPSKAQKRKKKISLSRKAKKERGVNC